MTLTWRASRSMPSTVAVMAHLDGVASPRQALEVTGDLDPGEAAAEDEHPMRPGRLGAIDRPHRCRSSHRGPQPAGSGIMTTSPRALVGLLASAVLLLGLGG